MDGIIFKVPEELDGKDIKHILKFHLKLSDRLITKLKKGDGILLNDKKEFVIKSVSRGDILKINFPEATSQNIVPNDIPLDIIYEDGDLIVLNKPHSMPTHPSLNHYEGTLANAVMYYFRSKPFIFRAITRLDADTTGIVVVAKNPIAAHRLCESIKKGEFQKEYNAICVGTPNPLSGEIFAPIKRETQGIIKRRVAEDGKPSHSSYEVIKTFNGLSLVRLVAHTGRTHQLRVHMSHIGTPIFGDFMYGAEISGERTRLHCRSISFPHPLSGEIITVQAPLPADMEIENIKL